MKIIQDFIFIIESRVGLISGLKTIFIPLPCQLYPDHGLIEKQFSGYTAEYWIKMLKYSRVHFFFSLISRLGFDCFLCGIRALWVFNKNIHSTSEGRQNEYTQCTGMVHA